MSDYQAAVRRLEFQFGIDAFRTTSPDQTTSALGIASTVGEITRLKEASPRFFQRFDYSWAMDPASYTDPLSAMYQLFLLEILSEISPDHRSYPNAGNIAVRFLPTASIAAHCREVEGFHFILLPTTFLKVLQEFVLMTLRLRSLPTANGATTVKTNHFFGAAIERKLRYSPDLALPHVERFLLTLSEYARFSEPWIPHISVTTEFNLLGPELPQEHLDVLALYVMSEMFVVCHELAHLLEHRGQDSQRRLEDEVDADRSASSLLIIHNSRHLLHRHGLALGPIAFFQLMRAAVLVRRVVTLLDGPKDSDGGITDEAKRRASSMLNDEYELKLRAKLYERHLIQWGFGPLIGSTYGELLHELYLPVAAIQHKLLTSIGSTDHSWDSLLQ